MNLKFCGRKISRLFSDPRNPRKISTSKFLGYTARYRATGGKDRQKKVNDLWPEMLETKELPLHYRHNESGLMVRPIWTIMCGMMIRGDWIKGFLNLQFNSTWKVQYWFVRLAHNMHMTSYLIWHCFWSAILEYWKGWVVPPRLEQITSGKVKGTETCDHAQLGTPLMTGTVWTELSALLCTYTFVLLLFFLFFIFLVTIYSYR